MMSVDRRKAELANVDRAALKTSVINAHPAASA
jgi:hypothetical protein